MSTLKALQHRTRELRQKHGMTIEQAAKLTFCSHRAWQRFETAPAMSTTQFNNFRARARLFELEVKYMAGDL